MNNALGPAHRDRILAVVDETTAQQDWQALEHSYQDFRNGIDELREYFGQLQAAPKERRGTDD
ncbi:hypothetical protein LVY72_11545 [Arthrobacter sp. I2-34]|uniref:Uncharacterized protein n=1 Tax=Arthrobacter hankyongi TaxID=2904801 RepID=A0ABS9L793_9MICC|nr:hypothetical protein [Arthrobacter hankyongi]MCG2622546.1 hypothetical protein [Arthrobacter hankyongi]